MTSLVNDVDPFPVSVPPGSTGDPSVVLEMFYVFPLHEPFRLSPTSGCHFLHDSWVSILILPTYVLNYLCALHWLSQCCIYHLYNDNQQIHICRPGFTPSCLSHTSKKRVEHNVWYTCEHRPCMAGCLLRPDLWCNDWSQSGAFFLYKHFVYLSTMWEFFSHPQKYLPSPIVLEATFPWYSNSTLWIIDTGNSSLVLLLLWEKPQAYQNF